MFDSPEKLFLGLITGMVFGFFLQKGRVAKHDVIVGAFLFKDFTAVKIMATAAALGSLGVYFLIENGLASFHVKEAQFGGLALGGLLFGVGVVLYGYCPGTGVAASGEGHRDAWVGLVGMIFGAIAYVLTFPLIEKVRESFPYQGKMTFPELTNTTPWIWIAGFLAVVASGAMLAKIKSRSFHRSLHKKSYS